mmetsp:Transcript_8215/g.7627  ORF Transcript_8215/g.7627 Transcript_8215/m.7627 type:complete len:132 (+) Transcript_8215:451-846(+)
MVGDIVKIHEKEVLPADVLILASSGDKGLAYCSTASLDGERNLKFRQAHASIQKKYVSNSEKDFLSKLYMDFYTPNVIDKNFHHFEGVGELQDEGQIEFKLDQALFRGCVIENTPYIIGLVIFTGKETKIM